MNYKILEDESLKTWVQNHNGSLSIVQNNSHNNEFQAIGSWVLKTITMIIDDGRW